MFSTPSVTDDQLQAIWRACSEVATQPDARQACRRLAERLSEILHAPALVFRRDVSPWKVVSPPGTFAFDMTAPAVGELDQVLPFFDGAYKTIQLPGGAPWTAVPLDEDLPSQSLLLLPGDWTDGRPAAWLPRFAATASIAIRLAAARNASRSNELLAATAHAFAQKLTRLSGDRTLHQCIVDTAAQMTDARLAGLSMYQAAGGRALRFRDLWLSLRVGRPRPHRARIRHHRGGLCLQETAAGPGHGPGSRPDAAQPPLPDRLLHGRPDHGERQRARRGHARGPQRRSPLHDEQPDVGQGDFDVVVAGPGPRAADETQRRARQGGRRSIR